MALYIPPLIFKLMLCNYYFLQNLWSLLLKLHIPFDIKIWFDENVLPLFERILTSPFSVQIKISSTPPEKKKSVKGLHLLACNFSTCTLYI